MARSVREQRDTNNRVTRPFQGWYVGDGIKTEFTLPRDVRRMNDLVVHVQGLLQRPDDPTGVFDYSVRGVTPGYNGSPNTVRFVVPPPIAANIHLFIHSD